MRDQHPMTSSRRQLAVRWLILGLMMVGIVAMPVAPAAGQGVEPDAQQQTTPAEEAAESVTADEIAPAEVAVEATQPEAEIEMTAEVEEVEEVERPRRVNRYDTSVQIFSSLTVEEDEVYEEAVAILGALTVHGVVEGDAVAIGGPVTVSGTVEGELVSVGGPVHLESSARVGKLVNVGGSLTRDEGSVVEDSIENVGGPGFTINVDKNGVEIDSGEEDAIERPREPPRQRRSRALHRVADFFGGLAWRAVALALLLFVLAVAGVLAPRLIDRSDRKLSVDPWKAAVAGLLTEIGFLPALVAGCIFLVISIVGIFLVPVFVPLMLLALVAALVVGFAAVAQRAGRLIVERFGWQVTGRVPQIVVGVVGLYAMSFLGWILSTLPGPFEILAWGTEMIGALILYIAWTVGLGALLLAAFDPPRGEQDQAMSPPPPLPLEEGE